MSKDRKNISLDAEVNEAIDNSVTYSDHVNEWTRQYFIEGNFYAVEKAMFEMMLESVQESREMMHEQVDEMHDELEAEIQSKIDHIDTVGYDENNQTGSSEKLQEAKEVLKDAPRDPTNPAVKNWAQKVNMSPSELLDELEEGGGPPSPSFSSTS